MIHAHTNVESLCVLRASYEKEESHLCSAHLPPKRGKAGMGAFTDSPIDREVSQHLVRAGVSDSRGTTSAMRFVLVLLWERGLMIVPLPTWLLDIVLATNISLSVGVLLVVLYVQRARHRHLPHPAAHHHPAALGAQRLVKPSDLTASRRR